MDEVRWSTRRVTTSCAVQVECRGASHTVRWRRGHLEFGAHAIQDFEDEVALAILGGEATGCAEVLQLWRRPAVKGLGGLHDIEPSGRLPGMLRRARLVTLARTKRRRWGERDPLDSPAIGWDEATLVEQEALAAARQTAAAAGVSVARLRMAVGPPRCTMTEADEPGAIRPRSGLLARFDVDLSLPPSWLEEVWVPGLEADGPLFVVALGEGHRVVVDWARGGVDIVAR